MHHDIRGILCNDGPSPTTEYWRIHCTSNPTSTLVSSDPVINVSRDTDEYPITVSQFMTKGAPDLTSHHASHDTIWDNEIWDNVGIPGWRNQWCKVRNSDCRNSCLSELKSRNSYMSEFLLVRISYTMQWAYINTRRFRHSISQIIYSFQHVFKSTKYSTLSSTLNLMGIGNRYHEVST